ncbi:MAG: diphosphomevalonate decarboxylase [Lentimicrobium sp.]|nr:diphosphomevalonate decarboxylase [Lentimicrobium sp.]
MTWRSPSNIALVKYWGKKPIQIPANPSLSITLSKAFTEMSMEFEPVKEEPGLPALEFLFEGRQQEKFEKKIAGFLNSLYQEYPILKEYRFKISSSNTFPHSTGIASSASSMSALGLCLADFLSRTGRMEPDTPAFWQEASGLSRLASGSACRSVFGGFVIWGHHPQLAATSDKYAIPVPFEVNPAFREMKDAILVVSSKEKEVSSRAGHSLMEGHPYAEKRFETALNNLMELSRALIAGDFDKFVHVTESEALNLHALMMTSNPSYILIEPNTINIVNRIRRFRKETSIPACFTLDAGPNVHLLYPAADEIKVRKWISEELLAFCEQGRWIDDEIGKGPKRIN